MAKKHLRLQHSESIVAQAATQIYSAYIAAGRVTDGEEAKWMQRSIREAVMIAQATDDLIISDDEIESSEGVVGGALGVGRIQPGGSKHD